jgi:hypothetical protein
MKKLVRKFGKYNLATYIIMIVGAILFLLTPLFIKLFNFDSDILGLLIFVIGLVMFIVGLIIRSIIKKS